MRCGHDMPGAGPISRGTALTPPLLTPPLPSAPPPSAKTVLSSADASWYASIVPVEGRGELDVLGQLLAELEAVQRRARVVAARAE